MKLDEVQLALSQIDNEKILKLIDLVDSHDKIMILGNGGSNSIASHISQDYTKQLNKRAFSFSDPSRLTCYINDYGMQRAYAQFVEEFADEDTLVILISSSGNSENIVRAARVCCESGIVFVTLTGFDQLNRVNTEFSEDAELNFWVDSSSYGVVECVHQIILHTPA